MYLRDHMGNLLCADGHDIVKTCRIETGLSQWYVKLRTPEGAFILVTVHETEEEAQQLMTAIKDGVSRGDRVIDCKLLAEAMRNRRLEREAAEAPGEAFIDGVRVEIPEQRR